MFKLECRTGARATDGVEFFGLAYAQGEGVEAVHAQSVHVAVAREVETNHHDQIGQDENGSFKVVALAFAVDVREQENAKDDGDHIPLREN